METISTTRVENAQPQLLTCDHHKLTGEHCQDCLDREGDEHDMELDLFGEDDRAEEEEDY